ncbi:hypothetical protein L917_13656, partial [Phytophthora nicotianae]
SSSTDTGTCAWLPTEWLSLFQGLNDNEHVNSHGLTKLDTALVVHDAIHQGLNCQDKLN